MAAVPPAPAATVPPAPPPDVVRGRPWRVVAVTLLAVALILGSATAFWYVTGTGPFSHLEPSSWALTMTQASDLQARGLDGAGVRVCVVDSGVDLSQPELRKVHLVAWKDEVAGQPTPYDDEGHGTAMAGILFAQGQLHGVAPKADLIAVKAITSSGKGSDAQIAAAIGFCVDPDQDGNLSDGANVISLSLGGANHPFLGSTTASAANLAMDHGVYVIAAAGNDGGPNDDGDVESPASEARVIAVGAVDREGVIAPFSSIGSAVSGFPPVPRSDPDRKPEVVAPGVAIWTVLNDGRYAQVDGTSPSAAFVSGIVALLLEAHPEYRGDPARLPVLKTALMETAEREAGQEVPHDPHYGYGLVQALSAERRL